MTQREPAPGMKCRKTIYLSRSVYDEAKGAVREFERRGLHPANLSALIEDALVSALERLRVEYNQNQPFTLHPQGLPGGRPASRVAA